MPTALLADDDTELREMYEIWLEGWDDLTVRTATDGDEALEKLDEAVDIAVLDRGMPGTSGDEVARRVDSSYPECRVLIVSAFQPDDKVDEHTYDQYLTKPVGKDDLVATIESQLNVPRIE